MSKNKKKALVKTARKTARKDIKLSLITVLKATASKLAPLSKSIEKEIRKDAKGLAKKISKALVIDGVALATADDKTASAVAAKPVVTQASKKRAKENTTEVKS